MNDPQINASQAFAWFNRAVAITFRHPLGLIGGSGIGFAVVALLVFGLMLATVAVLIAASGDPSKPPATASLFLAMAPIGLLAMIAGPWLMAGITTAIHEAENGQTPVTGRIFAGLTGGNAAALAGLAVVPMTSLLLTFAGYRIFGGADYINQYFAMFAAIQGGTTPVAPTPEYPMLLFVVEMLISMTQYLLQMLTIPLVQLGRSATFQAISQSFGAVLRWPGACLMLVIVFFFALLAAVVMIMFVALVLGAMAAVAPLLALVIAVPITMALAGMGLSLLAGVGYYAWRDMLAQPSQLDVARTELAGIEV